MMRKIIDSNPGRPKVGLGSGSARGLAHLGVIRAIEDAGIEVDFIAGTSMGALIGAIHAAGKLDDLEDTFQTFDWKKTVSFFDVILPKSGLFDGAKISDLVRAMFMPTRSRRCQNLLLQWQPISLAVRRSLSGQVT